MAYGKERIEVYGCVEGFPYNHEARAWPAFDQEIVQQCLRIRLTLEPGEEKTLKLAIALPSIQR